jgi:hypothetical protein
MYVAMGAIPLVTEVAQVMCLGDGVVVGETGGLQALGCEMAPSLVMAPPSEVVQPSARLPGATPRGRLLFLFGPNVRGTELPVELPLWGVPEEKC